MSDLPDDDRITTRWGRHFSFRERGRAYKIIFRNPMAQTYVLPDLMEFCGMADPAPFPGQRLTEQRFLGRRDVALRIQHQIQLTEEELYRLLRGAPIRQEE